MGIRKKWSKFNKKKVSKLKDNYGVYELADKDKKLVYVGQGKIKTRLLRHFIGKEDPIPEAAYYRFHKTGSKEKAEQRERSLLRKHEKRRGKLPKYNQRVG